MSQERKKKQLSLIDSIKTMSNQMLREALKSHDVTAGPITNSTRSIYMKKLASLMENGPSKSTFDTPSQSSSKYNQLGFNATPAVEDDDITSDEDFEIGEEESSVTESSDDNDSSDQTNPSDEESEEISDEEPGVLDELDDDIKLSSTTYENDTLATSTLMVGDTGPNRISRTILYSAISFMALIFAYRIQSNREYESKILLFGSMIVLPLIYGLYKLYCFYSKRCHQEYQRVCDLVNEALQLLQSPDNPKGMMPVLHIRDTLLTPSERNSKSIISLWNKAVKFVEQNESRVKVELVNIDGEDFRAWKWIGSKKL